MLAPSDNSNAFKLQACNTQTPPAVDKILLYLVNAAWESFARFSVPSLMRPTTLHMIEKSVIKSGGGEYARARARCTSVCGSIRREANDSLDASRQHGAVSSCEPWMRHPRVTHKPQESALAFSKPNVHRKAFRLLLTLAFNLFQRRLHLYTPRVLDFTS